MARKTAKPIAKSKSKSTRSRVPTNEEPETSKEELQSLNEELTTLNTQLQQKIDDARRMSDDLNNLLASSGIATLFLDTEFKIRRFTPATPDLYNLSSKDVGRPFSDTTGKVEDAKLLKDAGAVLENLAPIEREVAGEGDKCFVRRILPYRTQDGKIDGVVVTFTDVSDLKTSQRLTASAQEFAENIVNTVGEPLLVPDGQLSSDRKHQSELQRAQKMEAVGQLTGGLAHDFNNLLTVVIGNLELLQMRIDDAKLHELLNEALEASNLGAALTSQLLSFSKSQSLAPEHVALNDLVETMQPILDRTLGAPINIETRLTDELDLTLADPGQIESAILNLAINARDAMRHGGVLTVETRNVVLDDGYAATQVDVTPGGYVCLSVTDTGSGMDPEIQSRVFEPFFTTKGPGAGSGLGLSMVYGFAKQSGGHVSIYSEVGQGTTVNLFLPVTEGAVEESESAPSKPVAKPRNETILVVEDDPKVRRLTIIRLEELDYNVIAASDGPEAMEILKQTEEIDLVLSDIVMPGGMTGFDVAAKALAMRPDLKILLATGYAKGVETLTGGSAASEHKILRKPYGLTELARALRELLD